MRTAVAGQVMEVGVGEVFGVERAGWEASGYITEVELPDAVVAMGADRLGGAEFGGSERVIERYRCDRPGSYELVFRERRPWEAIGEVAFRVQIVCGCR